MTGQVLGIGRCFGGHTFSFDPDRVPVMLIDPDTGLPPDIGAGGGRVTPSPEAINRATQVPFCPRHAAQFNAARRERGLGGPFMTEKDTAVDLAWSGP